MIAPTTILIKHTNLKGVTMSKLIYAIYNTRNQQKWSNHYWKLCMRAIDRELPKSTYTEKHHMFPKSMYGNSDLIIELTAQEHFIAHQLLVKMFPKNRKLIYAARMMTINDNRSQKRNNNKLYAWLKESYAKIGQSPESNKKRSETQTGLKQSDETKRKKSLALMGHFGWNKGMHHTDEAKRKMSYAQKGKKKSLEHRRKLSEARKGKTFGQHSIETKKKMSEARKGRTFPQSKVTCPHCNMIGGAGNMKRYHFDNCKLMK